MIMYDNAPPLLPYYVYMLSCPQDYSVLYIGEGQGNRIEEHVKQVYSLISKGEDVKGDKQRRILDILNRNEVPFQRIIGRFETKDEALAVEAVLIKFIYGFENLTNEIHGHGSEYIRMKDDFSQIPGIDIPKKERERVNDGNFKNSKIAALSSAGAYDFLGQLQTRLIEKNFEFDDFSLKENKPFHPGESNGYLGLIVSISGVAFLVSFSKTCSLKLTIANTPSTRNDNRLKKLRKIVFQKGEKFMVQSANNTKVQGEGRYINFVQNINFQAYDIDGMLDLLNEFRQIMS
jgi:hypothetical protein